MDVLELVQSQDMLILDSLGKDVSEEFIAAMAGFKKNVLQETGSTDRAGISFRWLVGTLKGQTEVLLMAQVHTNLILTSIYSMHLNRISKDKNFSQWKT